MGNEAAGDGPASVSTATVYLVGAGPGHPGLLTLRAVECLRTAGMVLHDRLVPIALLQHAQPTAVRLCVEDLPGGHPDRYPIINQTMIDFARRGVRVVRLKGGDPLIFGRGGEEAEALRAAGVPYEIVPGVTAALGAAACAGLPLTHRRYSSAVAFITGHEQPGKSGSMLDWNALARFPGTLVFYMGIGRIDAIVAALVQAGKPASTPAVLVEQASTPLQRSLTTTLARIPECIERERIQAPALVILGEVSCLREKLAWFEHRPLFGQTVLVTRPQHQAQDLVQKIEELGGRAVVFSAVEIHPAPNLEAVDAVLDRLSTFDWLVFTSSNGVEHFLQRLRATGRDLRALGKLRLAAIGPATAEALRSYHLDADVVPTEYNSEGLAEALRERVRNGRVLLARADRGIDLLREELSRVAMVEQVAVYTQRDAELADNNPVLEELRQGRIDLITLTSSNIARVIVDALGVAGRQAVQAGRMRLVCISPRTSAAVRDLGLPVAGEAAVYTTAGILHELCRLQARADVS